MYKPYITSKPQKTRIIRIGNVLIGGGEPVRVQSMTNTNTSDVAGTIEQINSLAKDGCELIRVAVPDQDAVDAIKDIKSNITIPLIADIHFNYKLAIKAMEKGVDAVRINPGNIGGLKNTSEVVRVAKDLDKAIRIGVNSGSLDKDLIADYGVSSQAIVLSAMRQVEMMDKLDFQNYKVSLKASKVSMTIEAYSLFNVLCDAPVHIGVTEAGTYNMGIIKSSIGIGTMLMNGIGDTIRVSLTADPHLEVKAAWDMLKATGLRRKGVEIISCPTCGRTEIDLIKLANQTEEKFKNIDYDVTIAVMGCAVNGPGEAREADYGIAGGKGEGLIFKKGSIIKKVPEHLVLETLIEIIESDNN